MKTFPKKPVIMPLCTSSFLIVITFEIKHNCTSSSSLLQFFFDCQHLLDASVKEGKSFQDSSVFMNNWPSVSLVYEVRKFLSLLKVSVNIQWFEVSIK